MALEATAKKKTIMIVEDDPLLVKMYEAKFSSSGFNVIKAYDGEQALKDALVAHPDFILLDVMMPKMSGIDMLEKLRTDQWGRSVPVIILSNLSEKQEGEKAARLGVKEYLVKANFTPAEILAKIVAIIGS
jgi:DNA-binding response OmpR family regulator